MSISKDDLNKLIQQLPDNALPIAADFLDKLVNNPNIRYIPWDDEPTTEQDIEDIKNAKESFARGESIKLKNVIDGLLN
ncbi:hypothetical protein OB236_39675 [Paenibacillus sp. WQ 127069]|uniref:Addiction module antitoxin RelB n=1 Tax=Paenibacillus baimaensis TaxID=2982185 RepID=A0ABT2UW44_9BACL|nr:hypothetical protein [Paenibacillus sp. WQ 127069]MCU6798266.1 hypothetical protein [Paenibacillus sp. WQ 127069]